jgi:hypothetical protein
MMLLRKLGMWSEMRRGDRGSRLGLRGLWSLRGALFGKVDYKGDNCRGLSSFILP